MKRISKIFSVMLVVSIVIGNAISVCYAVPNVVQVISPSVGPGGTQYSGMYALPGGYYVSYYDFYDRDYTKVLEKGWHTNSVGRYYYRGDGNIFRNDWYWIDGQYYRFDEYGYVYRNRWIKDNNTGSWYFADSDGIIATGWKKIDNVWYYFNPERGPLYGVMARNSVMLINDYTFGCGFFAFNNDGSIVVNSWFDGHFYGSNGVRVY